MERGAMPREQINYPPVRFADAYDPAGPPIHGDAWPEPEINVTWSPEAMGGNVQLSLHCVPAYFESVLECGKDAEKSSAFSPSLDRAEINKLIKTLRRARDAAYGADQ